MASTEDENKSTSHPLYRKLILAAVAALGEERSNKAEISLYIETTFRESLPENHAPALSDALERMKESGELLIDGNNYLKPDPDSTPRRGRGRPPKPKQPLPEGYIPPTPRPRGRPPKPKDPLAASIAKVASGLPRRRGRPSTKHRPAVGGVLANTKAVGVKPAVSGLKRGRGRPPKWRAPGSDFAEE